MGDSGAAYIAQLNAVCQFLRQEGFVQAERQLLQELEQKFPSIGKLSPEEEEEEAGRQAHHAAQEAHAATAARPDLLEPQQHSQYQQHPAHTAGGGLGSQPPFPFPPPPARPQARLRPPHKIPKQKVPWGPDVDEYQSIEDVGYIRKDISGQQQFEELELLGSDLSEEPEGMATASGPLSSQRDDDYEGSSGGHGEGSEGEEEEEQGSSQGGGDVASLSETEDLGTRHMQQQQQQQRSSSFQSPASSTLELHPAGRWSAPGEQGSSDPTWDMGPQDIKLTEPVSTPSKGSGDQQQLSGENSRPVLSRVESLSSSLKDFDADRSHEQGESMASGPMSRAHSDSEQQPPELGGGEVIDFNPIPLAQATPQDLKAFGLHEQQQQGAKQQQQQQHGSDPAAQARLLSLLTHRLASAPSDDTLLQLADLAGQVGPGPWESVFGSLLPSLVHRVCVSPCAAHRELAMVLVHRLASHQPQLLRAPSTLQAVLPAVLVCEADASKEVMLAASHAVACLVLAAPPQRVLDILSAMLPPSPPLANSHPHSQPSSNPQGGIQPGLVQNALDAEDRGEVACAACRCVQRIAHSISAEELGPRVALDLLPGLVRACDHVRADVRKAAVFAIAEMWHKMGDASFSVHLAKLNQQQQHLVSWAYERIRLAASTRPLPQ
mmetsp:Transcript_29525/g.76574  ORF Transcript_29525/g.76574 Transcript_29525/m.76574 type:complete len:663 (-) Transcript_29525:559-2547(-)